MKKIICMHLHLFILNSDNNSGSQYFSSAEAQGVHTHIPAYTKLLNFLSLSYLPREFYSSPKLLKIQTLKILYSAGKNIHV